MNNRYRSIGLALTLVLLTASGRAQENAQELPPLIDRSERPSLQSPSAKESGVDRADHLETSSQPSVTAAATQEQDISETPCGPRCRESVERELRDLAAQESMATSTEQLIILSDQTVEIAREMRVLTLWQIGVGGVGAGLLIITLALTIRATNAAVEANKIAKEAVSLERAWVSVNKIIDVGVHNSQVDGAFTKNGIGFMLEWSNSGRTPAVQLKVGSRVRYIEKHQKFSDISIDELFQFREIAMMASGQPWQSTPISLNDQESEKLRRREIRLFVFARAEYFDVFSARRPKYIRKTDVCMEAIHSGGTVHKDGIIRDAIQFIPVEGQNSAT